VKGAKAIDDLPVTTRNLAEGHHAHPAVGEPLIEAVWAHPRRL